jgi:hypothetical protein
VIGSSRRCRRRWRAWSTSSKVMINNTRRSAPHSRPRDGIDDDTGWCFRETAEAPQGGSEPPVLDRRSSMKLSFLGNPARTRRRKS